jgi:AcrR family transcriptional regulator
MGRSAGEATRRSTTASGRSRAAAARTAARVDLRSDMVEAAAKVLADEGPSALSVRRVAALVGASTMVVYTHFHDKDGLVDAAVAEAFERFASALASVHEADPMANLRALGTAYRGFARHNPSWYRLLFWRSGGGRELPPASSRAFDSLSRAIGRVLAALDRPARDIEPAAFNVWAITHGVVSLELSGACPPDQADAAFERMLDFVEAALRGRA